VSMELGLQNAYQEMLEQKFMTQWRIHQN
jgi:hypothetical protein